MTHYKQIIVWRHELNKFKMVDEKEVLKFLTGKIFNGDNPFQNLIDFFSLLYCRLIRISILENTSGF